MATANSTPRTLAHADADIARVIADPCTSNWLKMALKSALIRDPIDVAADAQLVATLLVSRADAFIAINTVQS